MRRDRVTIAECREMNDLREAGIEPGEIADQFECGISTVYEHIRHDCLHIECEVDIDPAIVPDLLSKLAAELNRIPSTTDWDHWDERPCSSTSIESVCGSWQAVLEEAGLPTIAPHSPVPIRTLAYQQPDQIEPDYQVVMTGGTDR